MKTNMRDSFGVILCLLLVTTSQGAPQGRIIGGEVVEQEDAAFMAQIWGYHTFFMCAGTIISTKSILTAAHCIATMIEPENYSVTVGTTTLESSISRFIAEDIVVHPDFNFATNENDVGILILLTAIDMEVFPVRPIIIDSGPLRDEEIVTVKGWGVSEYPDGQLTKDLQSLRVVTIQNEKCQESYVTKDTGIKIEDSQICSSRVGGKGVCSGDVGGPLIRNGFQVGIISLVGYSCGSGLPDIHTRIEPFVGWIQENIK